MEPLVSVVLPLYNREGTIRRAIDSVLNQTYKNLELIVVDDGSTDASVPIVKEYTDDRIRLIVFPCNLGANAARNAGIKEAKGDYIAFQDSDDEWLPDKLSLQMDYMVNSGYKAVFCPYIMVLHGNVTQQIPSADIIQRIKKEGIVNLLRKRSIVGTPTLLITKDIVQKIGFFDEKIPRIQDYEYVIRIAKEYDIGCIEQPLIKAYKQKQSISTNRDAYYKAVEIILEKHGDFLDIENLFGISIPLNIYEDGESFIEELDRLRGLYAKGNREKENIFSEAIVRVLGLKYIEMKCRQKKYIESRILQLKEEEFAIYGAGDIGQNVYCELRRRELSPKLFIVSKYQENTAAYIDNIPVREIGVINDKNMEIVIAVSLKYQDEIMENLRKLGFNHYFVIDDINDVK